MFARVCATSDPGIKRAEKTVGSYLEKLSASKAEISQEDANVLIRRTTAEHNATINLILVRWVLFV
jgi:hypothetical protein